MKKNLLLLIYLLFLCTSNYSENYPFENNYYYYTLYSRYVFQDDIFTIYFDSWGNFEDYSAVEVDYTSPYTIENEYGYTVLKLKDTEYILFYDDSYLFFYHTENQNLERFSSGYWYTIISNTNYQEFFYPFAFVDASSYLTEVINDKVVSYKPENLSDSDLQLPWVEGDDGDGIGSYLVIEDDLNGRNNLFIFNGFFHPTKKYLYEYNNRVKTFLLQSEDQDEYYEIILALEDTPNMQEFKLPRRTKKFRLTIKDIYPGSKYNDTCIAGIFSERF